MEEQSQMFFGLVYSIVEGAMISLGKIKSPVTGKVERNLPAAAFQIDMLRMLKAKTQGNLTKEEENFLLEAISNLELNYVQEMEKGENSESKEKTEDNSASDASEEAKKE